MGLNFSGTEIQKIVFDRNGDSSKEIFRKFENGELKNKEIITKHPNVVFGVIKGKKSWGLHLKMWSEGISEGSFSKYEILDIFEKQNVIIPSSFLKEFDDLIFRMRVSHSGRLHQPSKLER